MKRLHLPTLGILGGCVFCISQKHLDLAIVIQRCGTGVFVISAATIFLCNLCRGRQTAIPKDRILKTACLVGFLEILYAVVQLFGIVPDNYRYSYFSGSLNNPAVFGMLLSFCLPISVYYAVKTPAKEKILWETASLVFAVFVVLSNSRTALLASSFGAFTVLATENKKVATHIAKSKHIRIIMPVCLAVALTAVYFYKQDSADGRLLIWAVCMEMIKEKPLTGWGCNGHAAQYMNFQADYLAQHPDSPFAILAGESQSPFNEFLHAALVGGIPCAIMFAGILGLLIWRFHKKRAEHRSVLLAFVYVFVIWCLFSYPLNVPFVWLVLLFIALSLGKTSLRIPFPKTLCAIAISADIFCLYALIKTSCHDIRRILLQERAAVCFDSKTVEEYECMCKEHPDDSLLLYNYGAMLHLYGKYEKSLEVFRACSKRLSDYNMTLLMGDDFQKLGQPDSALAYYKRAGEMIPSRSSIILPNESVPRTGRTRQGAAIRTHHTAQEKQIEKIQDRAGNHQRGKRVPERVTRQAVFPNAPFWKVKAVLPQSALPQQPAA